MDTTLFLETIVHFLSHRLDIPLHIERLCSTKYDNRVDVEETIS
jgi:hypothetical protein